MKIIVNRYVFGLWELGRLIKFDIVNVFFFRVIEFVLEEKDEVGMYRESVWFMF